MEPIISVSGLRGIVGNTLTPEIATRYVCAFDACLDPGPIVLTRDGRATGPMLADAVRAALCAVGRDVIDADIAATPTTGVLIDHLEAAGGIQISASHNPPEYNGLKLFNCEGRVISETAGQPVLQHYREQRPIGWKAHDQLGRVTHQRENYTEHARRVLETVATGPIRDAQFRVLLDANRGAGSLLGQHLLERLGCQVIVLGTPPDGQFEHGAEPTADNLRSVCSQVKAAQAVVGFCQDPDADRLALIDERGQYLGEEFTVAIVAKHVLTERAGPVVTNCSTSRMTEDIAAELDVPFFRSKVGEAHVTEKMRQVGAVFGGEGNGGPIDPRVGYVRDSFVGMAQVLDVMAKTGKALSQLAAELPQYAIYKTKATVPADQVAQVLSQLEKHFSQAQPNHMDGLRLDWADAWLLIRASNTEPIVRLVAEGPTQQRAAALCDEALKVTQAAVR